MHLLPPAPGAMLEDQPDASAPPAAAVVGIRRDAASRELLTWALVKVTAAGDRVVAVYVVTSPEEEEARSAEEELRAVLKVYDGFCHLKQIHLELKICYGKSIRKTLVQEAKACGAAKLVLGIATTNSLIFGPSSISVAKFCAKKVPRSCSVLAVNNGKIVFQKDAEQNDSCSKTLKSSRKSYRKLLAKSACGLKRSPPEYDDSMKDDGLNIPISSSVPQSPTASRRDSFAMVPYKGTASVRLKREFVAGWPLIRKKLLGDWNGSALEKQKISVLRWAMRLPNRYATVSPVHQDYKYKSPGPRSNSDKNVKHDSTDTLPDQIGEVLEKEVPEELVALKDKYSSMYTLFSYKELQEMTGSFSPDNIIGYGGNSCVYKGSWINGKELAVKILKLSDEVLKDFVSEIEIVSSLNHKNIISLEGFCFDEDSLILVYDYLPKGSLEEVLHGDNGEKEMFGWNERFKVALGIAEALDHLHGSSTGRGLVIHRDVKSSNILLSEDFEPKLSDYGLALWGSSVTANFTSGDVAGTFGYLAPEYFMFGKVSDKIDVYAFGVVLLELISGRMPVWTKCPKGQESIVKWASSILEDGKLFELVDPQLSIEGHKSLIEKMILAAAVCTKQAAQARPQMSIVLKLLNGDEDILKWARCQVASLQQAQEGELELGSKIQSYINLALLDMDDDSASVSSNDHPDFINANTSLEEYLRGRWSRSSSFD